MRILLVSDWMSDRGGAESYILALRDGLRAQGDEAKLLVCGAPARVPLAGDLRAYGSDSVVAQALLQVINPFAVSSVRAAVRDFKPDAAIVSQFAYHLSPAILRALEPVPTAVTMMDYKAICPVGTKLLPDGSICRVRAGFVCNGNGCVGAAHWLRDQPRYALLRSAVSRAHIVISPSGWVQKELADVGIAASTIPLGVRAEVTPAGPPSALPTFAYVGRLSREKGVALLFAAFARIVVEQPCARLKVVGDGPLRRPLEALAATLGLTNSVEFTGLVPMDEVARITGSAWAVVCPSIWAEPFGLAAVEGILSGIPVVAADSGGFSETIEHGVNGLLFPRGSASGLEQSLRMIVSGKAFPGHRLPESIVERERDRYRMDVHAARVKQALSKIMPTPQ